MIEDSLPPTTQIPSSDSTTLAGEQPANSPDPAIQGTNASHWKEYLIGSLAFLLFLAMLLCAGQAALFIPLNLSSVDTRSRIKADYSLWPRRAIPAVNPLILKEIAQETLVSTQLDSTGAAWENLQLPTVPTDTPTPSLTPSPRPSRTPRPTLPLIVNTPIPLPTATELAQPTARPTRTRPPAPAVTNPPSIPTRAPTQRVPTVTDTLRPTSVPSRTPTPTITRTPTNTGTATNTPSNTRAPTHTPTRTSTFTSIPSRTRPPTRTSTNAIPGTTFVAVTMTLNPETPMGTPMPSATGTESIPPTLAPTPLGNLNEGTPDANVETIACNRSLTIDFGSRGRSITSFVFYEEFNDAECHGICMDKVGFYLSNFPVPATLPRAEIFFWGDDITSNNGFIFPYHINPSPPREEDNEPIPSVELFSNADTDNSRRTGICILLRTPGTYRYLHIIAPPNCGDDVQVDAFQINIDLSFCPMAFTPSQTLSAPR